MSSTEDSLTYVNTETIILTSTTASSTPDPEQEPIQLSQPPAVKTAEEKAENRSRSVGTALQKHIGNATRTNEEHSKSNQRDRRGLPLSFWKVHDEKRRLAGGRVLVHCLMGVSRSASVVLAYLVKYRGMSLEEAHELVRRQRPMISPNRGFWEQLSLFEKEFRRKNSIDLDQSEPGTELDDIKKL
ncbi:hypothetical protein BV898_12356 [Hypsibius exemplaris]|uniref:Dual specificity protein phosphatase 14 n=1 Tax=Hypsibius exemplaris TaxID=2072580 RepID=A0A1W0WDX3_HYPEX|nr:hypothetical protein BV898_12356 [Hypsibius exemplaris]